MELQSCGPSLQKGRAALARDGPVGEGMMANRPHGQASGGKHGVNSRMSVYGRHFVHTEHLFVFISGSILDVL